MFTGTSKTGVGIQASECQQLDVKDCTFGELEIGATLTDCAGDIKACLFKGNKTAVILKSNSTTTINKNNKFENNDNDVVKE
jgi:hypothetical protein